MGKYKIYRGFLPNGKEKIGCTQYFPKRCEKQEMYDYYIVEEYDCIYTASDREIELQIQHLGERDNISPYYAAVQNGKEGGCYDKEFLSKIGTKGAYSMWEKYPDMGNKISETHQKNGRHKGSGNPASKLNEDIVRYIRKWCKPQGENGTYSQARMARAMGISKGVVSSIVTRRTWKHI